MSGEGELNIRKKVIVHVEEELANTFNDMKVIVFIIKRNGAVKIKKSAACLNINGSYRQLI